MPLKRNQLHKYKEFNSNSLVKIDFTNLQRNFNTTFNELLTDLRINNSRSDTGKNGGVESKLAKGSASIHVELDH
jgi:hypothetical protein